MKNYIGIDGHNNLARHIGSHGVVNTDKRAMELAKDRKNKVLSLQREVTDMKSRLERLEKIVLDDLR